MMKLILLNAIGFAEEAHHAAEGAHGAHGIPWAGIGVQAFNLGVLVVLLVYFLAKAARAHFKNRAQAYQQLVARAEEAKNQAEKTHREIKTRLAELESSAEQSIRSAQTEADQMKQRLMSEAKSLVQKLEKDAQRAVEFELEKAKAHLRQELLERALESSRDNLSKNLGSTEQKKLQNEFVEKIQVVGG